MNRKAPLLFAFLLLTLSGCKSPITYAPDHSTTDLPTKNTPLVIEPATEGTMLNGDEMTEQETTSAGYKEDVRKFTVSISDAVKDTLKEKGFTIASRDTKRDPAFTVKPKFYYLPFNPVTGGHINIFLKLIDPNNKEILTAFSGRDFVLLSFAFEGGPESIVTKTAKHATEKLADELNKKTK